MIKKKTLKFLNSRTSGGVAFSAGLITITGLIISTMHPVIGIFQTTFGFGLLSYSNETWIDLERKQFKIVTSIFLIPFGYWEDLPKERFLFLKKNFDSKNLSHFSGDFTARVFYYKIFLKSPEISLELIGERNERDAINKATNLARQLDVELKMDLGKK